MPALMILGLRRSGTTAFWKQFRRDRNLKCFDEPFSEQLIRLPSEHPKMVWSEYRDIFDLDPSLFWRYYAPIHRVEELRSDFHPRQATYINWLAQQSKNTVFDLTRCHLKLEALSELLPDARVIHLKRSRSAFTSSHLIPSRSGRFGKLRSLGYTRSFWDRKSGFDSWGMESLAGTSPASAFGLGIGRLGGDAEAFYRAPACVRLGVMWEWFGWHVDREGPRLFGSRFAYRVTRAGNRWRNKFKRFFQSEIVELDHSIS